MKKSQIFLYSCLSFILGIGLSSLIETSSVSAKAAGDRFFIGFVILVLGIVILSSTLRDKKQRVVGLVIIFFALGMLRYNIQNANLSLGPALKTLDPHGEELGVEGRMICKSTSCEYKTFIGVVSEEPDKRIDHIKLKVKSLKLKVESKVQSNWRVAAGNVLVNTGLYPEYQYGDELEISCQLKTPEKFEGFDYQRYLATKGIYSICYNPKIKLLAQGKGNRLYTSILSFKGKLETVVKQGLPEPQQAIFSAMFLGVRRGISQELLDEFNRVGVSHIIAISGLHITIISTILMSILIGIGFWRKQAFWLASGFLLVYIIMIGAPASAVRAGIMGFLLLLAMNLGRLNKSLNALVFVACLMLLANPKILRSDVGFQLSFVAVLGIIYFLPLFGKIFKKVPEQVGLQKSLIITFSAQVMTLPLIAYQFHRVSIIAPLVNILILPFLPFVLIFGAIATFSGLIWVSLAKILFVPTWLLLTYLVKIVEIFSNISFAGVEIEEVPFALVTLIYLGIGVGIWKLTNRYK